ncbi:MAG: hypothetical protein MdMp014T_2991 [Treponematales bacterium]
MNKLMSRMAAAVVAAFILVFTAQTVHAQATALEGTWTAEDNISFVFNENNFQLWGIRNRLNRDRRPDASGTFTLARGGNIRFNGLPDGWAAAYKYSQDGNYLLLTDSANKFPVAGAGSNTRMFVKNNAKVTTFTTGQEGGSPSSGTSTAVTVTFSDRVNNLTAEDISIVAAASDAGAITVSGVPTSRDSRTWTVPVTVDTAGALQVYVVKSGVTSKGVAAQVYKEAPRAARQPPAPPAPEPARGRDRGGPQARGNQLTESDIKLDEFQGRGVGARFTIKVKCINGETPDRYTSMDKMSGYQVELAALGRDFSQRNPERADWKSMEVAFKGINASGNRISSANDSYGFLVSDEVRANVYGRRGPTQQQPIVIRVRARTSDSRSAPWGDWVYLTGDGKGY